MAEKKYAKYFSKLGTREIRSPFYGTKIREPIFYDRTIYEESPIAIGFILIYGSDCGAGFGVPLSGGIGDVEWRDLPHSHDIDEVFIYVGTDPKNYKDLGGEVEFWLGEGEEAEKYTFNEPTAIIVPANVVHNPIYYRNVRRPFFHIWIHVLLGREEKEGWDFNWIDVLPPGFKEKWTGE